MPDRHRSLVRLTLTDEQRLMRDSARKFGIEHARGRAHARRVRDDPASFYQKTWSWLQRRALCQRRVGFGASRSPVSNLLLAGPRYGDMSLAVGTLSSLSFINTVLDQGPDQIDTLLAPFAQDAFAAAAIALVEPGARFDPRKLTRATRTPDGYVLLARKPGAVRAERRAAVDRRGARGEGRPLRGRKVSWDRPSASSSWFCAARAAS